ncbi:MAG: hypothetical protein WCI53_09595 [Bacteroidota bacterium]|jgi:hypothetical protein
MKKTIILLSICNLLLSCNNKHEIKSIQGKFKFLEGDFSESKSCSKPIISDDFSETFMEINADSIYTILRDTIKYRAKVCFITENNGYYYNGKDSNFFTLNRLNKDTFIFIDKPENFKYLFLKIK